nr:neuroglobin-like [Pocillopora verrucosa]
MGCSSSLHNKELVSKVNISNNLSDAQKIAIQMTWKTVEENRTKIGKQTWIRVFELNPQIKKMMPEFNTNDPVEELKSARALFGHSKTYMKCLENAVTSMDDNERFVTYLVELGRRHQVRPLKAHYLDLIHEAFMFSLKEIFQSEWTSETFEAWDALSKFMFKAMLTGLNDT